MRISIGAFGKDVSVLIRYGFSVFCILDVLTANHCLNGGQCYVDRIGLPQCRCKTGFTGNQCEVVTTTCPGMNL